MARWREESGRRGVLCHCQAHSCRQQHSKETFIVSTVGRPRRLDGDIRPMRLFGIQADVNIKHLGDNFDRNFHLYSLKFPPLHHSLKGGDNAKMQQ